MKIHLLIAITSLAVNPPLLVSAQETPPQSTKGEAQVTTTPEETAVTTSAAPSETPQPSTKPEPAKTAPAKQDSKTDETITPSAPTSSKISPILERRQEMLKKHRQAMMETTDPEERRKLREKHRYEMRELMRGMPPASSKFGDTAGMPSPELDYSPYYRQGRIPYSSSAQQPDVQGMPGYSSSYPQAPIGQWPYYSRPMGRFPWNTRGEQSPYTRSYPGRYPGSDYGLAYPSRPSLYDSPRYDTRRSSTLPSPRTRRRGEMLQRYQQLDQRLGNIEQQLDKILQSLERSGKASQ